MSVLPTSPTVTVNTKSAWTSKINWVQAVTAVSMILAFLSGGKMSLTPDQQAALVVVIGVVGNIATWIIKTWFTPTVSPSSVPPAAVTPAKTP